MKQPTNILTESIRVDETYHDWHYARKEAARRTARDLAEALLRSEFNKPQIVAFEMLERKEPMYGTDPRLFGHLITGRLIYQPFSDWVFDNLIVNEEVYPFGKMIPVPWSDQYVMAPFEGRIMLK